MLQRIKQNFEALSPNITGCIKNLSNTDSLEALSDLLEEDLPDDLIQFYSEFTGNDDVPLENFVYGTCFHSLQTCLSRAESQAETDSNPNVPDYPLEFSGPEIDSRYTFNRSRVEIGHDWGTYLLCVDFTPTKYGNFGQIIMLDYDVSKAFVIAGSISELMDQFSEDLINKKYELTSTNRNGYWLEPKAEIDLANWHISPSRWSHVKLS